MEFIPLRVLDLHLWVVCAHIAGILLQINCCQRTEARDSKGSSVHIYRNKFAEVKKVHGKYVGAALKPIYALLFSK